MADSKGCLLTPLAAVVVSSLSDAIDFVSGNSACGTRRVKYVIGVGLGDCSFLAAF